MKSSVMKTSVTTQILEMLLENWGLFCTTGSWGPRVATECGSAERAWNTDASRRVWSDKDHQPVGAGDADGLPRNFIAAGRSARRLQADDAQGALVERLLQDAPLEWRRVLLHRYGFNRTGYVLATSMNTSIGQVEALLVSARVHVHERLEAIGYA